MKIERLRVQGLENPLGLTEQTPVFSYRLVRSGGETGEGIPHFPLRKPVYPQPLTPAARLPQSCPQAV